jgi:hypothetical protein
MTLSPMNSSAASCSTFCRKVSIVSVTMASSPAAVERPTSRVLGCCSLPQSRLRSENPHRHRIYIHRAPVAAVAWSSSKSSSVPLRRARHHPRHPLPGWRCRNASQRVSSYRRSGASAIGGSRSRVGPCASAVQMTATCLPSPHRVDCALARRPLHLAPLPSDTLQPPRHLHACIGIFKSP